MQTSAYVALSQQTVLNRTLDVLANNIANMSTPAFKAERPVFQEALMPGPNGQTVSYVRDVGVVRDLRQGDLTSTGNPLDVSIDGAGYFTVDTPDGSRYTRNGRFQIGPQGVIETSSGHPVLSDQGKPITVPAGSTGISISVSGTISTSAGVIGKIGVVSFADPQQLSAASDDLFVTDATPTPDTTSQIRQGMIEQSNIQPVVELTRLLDIQRAYNSAQQMVDGEDTRIRNAIDKLSQAA
jgi:flagellar basal-body rod protein FlgF